MVSDVCSQLAAHYELLCADQNNIERKWKITHFPNKCTHLSTERDAIIRIYI